MASHPLLDGSPAARAVALTAVAERDAAPDRAELAALDACLADPHKLVQRRAAETFAALARRGVEVEAALRAALAAPELRRRWGAVYALSLIGPLPPAALPTLLDVLGVDDGDLRWAAGDLIKQLAARERSSVVAALLAVARAAAPPRKMALYCLRDLGVAEAVDAALSALADGPIETRLAALSLLSAVHPDPAVAAQRIAALIDDGDPRMQRAAAATLGGLGVRTDAVMSALRRASSSDDSSLRRAAAHSLRMLAGGDGPPLAGGRTRRGQP